MYLSTIPTMKEIVLTGLDFSMKPERVRFEVDKGFITPFPELKVMHQIKSLAIMVYTQEKLTSIYHGHICDARNALAYFICAVHRQQAPQPQTHTRQSSTSSVDSNSSKISCKSTGRKKNCELPTLVTTSMLPLGHWDGLYYALVSEVRALHKDLQDRFGFGCENGRAPLHHGGTDGTTNQPINAIKLAAMLESAWYTLMDNRLVATLDDAVRMRKMRDDAARQLSNPSPPSEDRVAKRPPIVYGLMDVNHLTPDTINTLLWDRYKTEIDNACVESFEDQSMMTVYHAELRQKQIQESISATTPLSSALSCTCHITCICKMKCDETAEGCTCQNQIYPYHNTRDNDDYKDFETRDSIIKQDANNPSHSVDIHTANASHTQITYPDVRSLTTRDRSKDGFVNEDVKVAEHRPKYSRKRTNTANSELAYVPSTGVPYRGVKDPNPLSLYGSRDSMHRYPTIPQQTPSTPFNEAATSHGSIHTVSRKPVPPPELPASHYQPSNPYRGHAYDRPLTPPGSNPIGFTPFRSAGQVTYPVIPPSLTQRMLAETLATSQSIVPPTAEQAARLTNRIKNQKAIVYSADDYTKLISDHPAAIDDGTEAFPTLTRSTTRSPSKKSKRTSPVTNINTWAGFKPFRKNSKAAEQEKPLPVHPVPEFIAPKIATKQRYVSAGGFAKLSDRAEIAGPEFTHTPTPTVPCGTPVPPYSGHGLRPESIEAKMNDEVWIKANFGPGALPVAAASISGPASEDSYTAVIRSSSNGEEAVRSSNEVEMRDRTSSSASRMSKFKKVFSRKDSGSRGDEE